MGLDHRWYRYAPGVVFLDYRIGCRDEIVCYHGRRPDQYRSHPFGILRHTCLWCRLPAVRAGNNGLGLDHRWYRYAPGVVFLDYRIGCRDEIVCYHGNRFGPGSGDLPCLTHHLLEIATLTFRRGIELLSSLRLEAGQLLILQHQQAMHVFEAFLEIIDLIAKGLGLKPRCLGIFTRQQQLVLDVAVRLVTPDLAGADLTLVLGAGGSDPQFGVGITGCSDTSGSALSGWYLLARCLLHVLTALRQPLLLSLAIDLTCLRPRQGKYFVGTGHTQHLSTLQTVDVPPDEGFGIGPVQRDHHLLHAGTVRAQLARDTPQGLVGIDRAVSSLACHDRWHRATWCRGSV